MVSLFRQLLNYGLWIALIFVITFFLDQVVFFSAEFAFDANLRAFPLIAHPAARYGYFQDYPPFFLLVHIIFGTFALISGAVAFHPWIQKSHLSWHRWIGFAYVVSTFLSAVGAIVISWSIPAGPVVTSAYSVGAAAWVFCALNGIPSRHGTPLHVHEDWMIRSYVFLMMIVTARVFFVLYADLNFAFGLQMNYNQYYEIYIWVTFFMHVYIGEHIVHVRRKNRSRRHPGGIADHRPHNRPIVKDRTG